MPGVYVAGHNGMVGSAIGRRLSARGEQVLSAERAELDLTDSVAVSTYIQREKPDVVVVAAAKVGGIHANSTYPAEFIRDNLLIETNLVHAAWEAGVERLLFLGSSCIYPRMASQPMSEDTLLSGALEATNEPYAVAKIAGIKLCESYNRQYGTDYRSVMPTNLYGSGDNFHAEDSHVIPALMRRFHEAKESALPEVQVWGTGKAMREFLHVDDLADACIHVLNLDKSVIAGATEPMCSHINIGTGQDVTIRELAETIKSVVGYEGELTFDSSRPDGTPRKLLDVSKINTLGWRAKIDLEAGLQETYEWYRDNAASARG